VRAARQDGEVAVSGAFEQARSDTRNAGSSGSAQATGLRQRDESAAGPRRDSFPVRISSETSLSGSH